MFSGRKPVVMFMCLVPQASVCNNFSPVKHAEICYCNEAFSKFSLVEIYIISIYLLEHYALLTSIPAMHSEGGDSMYP
jgi:hypothetical protein